MLGTTLALMPAMLLFNSLYSIVLLLSFVLIYGFMQVIKAGYASCTGLSIFLVNALRAVGVPARMAGGALHPDQMSDSCASVLLQKGCRPS